MLLVTKKRRHSLFILLSCLMLLLAGTSHAGAEAFDTKEIPQIDSSTARIPITDAIYGLLTDTYGMAGPEPICSKTHGAWINLADGTADILFLIAPTDDEFAYFAEKGIDIEMKVFGYDGLVFIGNESNPVESLSSAEIRSIYSGEIKNWSNISGGKDADMKVYIRNPESGSQRLFESLVWAGYAMPDFSSMRFIEGEIDPTVTQREKEIIVYTDMDEITESVLVNQYSIGFNIMSYIDNEFLRPDEESVQSVRTTGSVTMRKGPGLGYGSVGSIPKGVSLQYHGETSRDERGVDWYNVEYKSHASVWISSRYSKLDGGASRNLKLFSIDGYAPTTENFKSGGYPFLTTSYVVIRADEPADSPTRQLYDWVGSEESRALISENSTLSVSFTNSVVLRTVEGDPAANLELAQAIERLDKEKLKRRELFAFTQEEVAYLRQGIYALSGKIFPQQKYDTYFRQKNWYQERGGSDKEIAERFNEYQSANLETILIYEKQLRRANGNRTNRIGNVRALAYVKGTPDMQGEDVLAVQQALAAQGYLAAEDCDGVFGAKSAEAVAAFQVDNDLAASGVVNGDTWMLLH